MGKVFLAWGCMPGKQVTSSQQNKEDAAVQPLAEKEGSLWPPSAHSRKSLITEAKEGKVTVLDEGALDHEVSYLKHHIQQAQITG